MKTTDPFSRGVLEAADLYRQTRSPLPATLRTSISHADDLKRLMDQIDGPLRTIKALPNDSYGGTIGTMLQRIRDNEGLNNTMRAIESAQKQREPFVRTLAGTDVLRTRELATRAVDTGILRTADLLRRNSETIASAIAATRPRDELLGLASSIMQRMDALRLTSLRPDAFPESTVDLFAEQFSKAQRVAEELDQAETEEQRAAILVRLIAIIAAALKTVPIAKRDVALGVTVILALIGLAADIKSLLPSEPPPGMSVAQLHKLNESHRDVDTLIAEFSSFRNSEQRIDEAYVANLPRAELHRQATIRSEPDKDGKALLKAPAGTLLAIAGSEGRWRQVVYRDPLTDELAEAWVFGPAVSVLDDR